MANNPHIDQYIMEQEDEFERRMNEAREENAMLREQRDALLEALGRLRRAVLDCPALDSSEEWTDLIQQTDDLVSKLGIDKE